MIIAADFVRLTNYYIIIIIIIIIVCAITCIIVAMLQCVVCDRSVIEW